jgi:maleylpyruvate isomerase
VHLNVEWRDLPADAWNNTVRTAQGRSVPASETVWMRTREVWIHAVDLNNGGSFHDMPPDLLDAFLTDITGAWRQRGHGTDLELAPLDRSQSINLGTQPTVSLIGTAADLARWATGRGTHHLTTSSGEVIPSPPRWL